MADLFWEGIQLPIMNYSSSSRMVMTSLDGHLNISRDVTETTPLVNKMPRRASDPLNDKAFLVSVTCPSEITVHQHNHTEPVADTRHRRASSLKSQRNQPLYAKRRDKALTCLFLNHATLRALLEGPPLETTITIFRMIIEDVESAQQEQLGNMVHNILQEDAMKWLLHCNTEEADRYLTAVLVQRHPMLAAKRFATLYMKELVRSQAFLVGPRIRWDGETRDGNVHLTLSSLVGDTLKSWAMSLIRRNVADSLNVIGAFIDTIDEIPIHRSDMGSYAHVIKILRDLWAFHRLFRKANVILRMPFLVFNNRDEMESMFEDEEEEVFVDISVGDHKASLKSLRKTQKMLSSRFQEEEEQLGRDVDQEREDWIRDMYVFSRRMIDITARVEESNLDEFDDVWAPDYAFQGEYPI